MKISHQSRARLLRECLGRRQEGESLDVILSAFPDDASWLKPELEVAEWLSNCSSKLGPGQDFEDSGFDRLLEQRRKEPGDRIHYRAYYFKDIWRRTGRRNLTAVFLATILFIQLVINGSGLARASSAWLPGDVLYPLKTTTEYATVAFTFDQASRARIHIELSRRRILEIQALIIEGRYEQIPSTVLALEGHVAQAVQLLNELAESDTQQARDLAVELQEALASQTGFVLVLARFTPPPTWSACERVKYIYEDGTSAIEGLLSPYDFDLQDSS